MDGVEVNIMIISGKREFDYEKEEKFFLRFLQMMLFICAFIFVWGIYTHVNQINLQKNATSVVAEVQGERLKYTADDGITYFVNTSGMFLKKTNNTTMVYYIETPSDAVPLTDITFFLIIYLLTIPGMIFAIWQIDRTKRSIKRNTPIE